jgi:hypothetical protein
MGGGEVDEMMALWQGVGGLPAGVAVDLWEGPVVEVGGPWRGVGAATAAGDGVVLLGGQELVGQGDGQQVGVCRGQVVVVALWGAGQELISQVRECARGGGYVAPPCCARGPDGPHCVMFLWFHGGW